MLTQRRAEDDSLERDLIAKGGEPRQDNVPPGTTCILNDLHPAGLSLMRHWASMEAAAAYTGASTVVTFGIP